MLNSDFQVSGPIHQQDLFLKRGAVTGNYKCFLQSFADHLHSPISLPYANTKKQDSGLGCTRNSLHKGARTLEDIFEHLLSGSHVLVHFEDGETEAQRSHPDGQHLSFLSTRPQEFHETHSGTFPN